MGEYILASTAFHSMYEYLTRYWTYCRCIHSLHLEPTFNHSSGIFIIGYKLPLAWYTHCNKLCIRVTSTHCSGIQYMEKCMFMCCRMPLNGLVEVFTASCPKTNAWQERFACTIKECRGLMLTEYWLAIFLRVWFSECLVSCLKQQK